MLIALEVRAPFAFNGSVQAQFADGLALALDCAICRKKHRTVVVSPIERFSYCTPTQHTFPARVIDRTMCSAFESGPTAALESGPI